MNPYPFTLGRYEILKPLAEGGFGQVYLARILGEAGFHRTVAMKRIRPELTASPGFVDDFIKEARLGGYLQHHNVVQVLGFERLEGHYVLVMDYVDGVGLDAVIETMRSERKKFPMALVAELGAQAADGLQYVHNLRSPEGLPLQLVHRDLKPSNLLISRAGLVKVTDFGIARTNIEVGERTQAGQIKGTVAYLSPEQARGDSLDSRSDLYSMGAILFELLALDRMYKGDSTFALLSAVGRNTGLNRLSELSDEAKVFVPLLTRLLTSEPAERIRSAQELGDALRDIHREVSRPGATLVNYAREWAEVSDRRAAEYSSVTTPVAVTAPAVSGIDAWRKSSAVWPAVDLTEEVKKTSVSSSTLEDAGAGDFARAATSLSGGKTSATVVSPGKRKKGSAPLVSDATEVVQGIEEPTDRVGGGGASRTPIYAGVGLVVLLLGGGGIYFATRTTPSRPTPVVTISDAPASTPAPVAIAQVTPAPGQVPPVQVAEVPAVNPSEVGNNSKSPGTRSPRVSSGGGGVGNQPVPGTTQPSPAAAPSGQGPAKMWGDNTVPGGVVGGVVPNTQPASNPSAPVSPPATQAEVPRSEPPPQKQAPPREEVASIPAPLPDPGVLVVSCRPAAQVFLNGQSVGETPITGLKKPGGSYKLRVSRPDMNFEKSVDVTIKSGGTTKVICTTDGCDVLN